MSDQLLILAFDGEFDSKSAIETIDEVIERGSRRLIFNMKRLTFIDSGGLGLLIRSQKRLEDQDGELVVSQPSRFLLRIFDVLGLDRIFKVFGSDEEALAYFGGEDGAAGVTARIIPVRRAGWAEAQPPEDDES